MTVTLRLLLSTALLAWLAAMANTAMAARAGDAGIETPQPGTEGRQQVRADAEDAHVPDDEDEFLADDPSDASDIDEENEWAQKESERIAVDASVIGRSWNQVPFQTRYFDYSYEEIERRWPQFMRALLIPFPSPAYLQRRIETFPELRAELGPDFDGDYERLSRNTVHAWRLFFRGDFREAKEWGVQFGAYGKVPAYFSQIIYAVYLSDTQDDKHQLLQDAANQVAVYARVLKEMEQSEEFRDDYMVMRLGYAYAIARIAEEVSPPVAVARNYLFKISGAANDVLAIKPDHPVGLAFRAGIDAGLIRTMGKAAGRLTFGAKQSRAKDYFEESFNKVDDLSIIHYEYANALLYMNKTREATDALQHLRRAMAIQPLFAMEALDAMYAAKRFREVDDFLKYGRSFRSFDRKRRRYVRKTDENLYNVLSPPFLITEYVARR
jgi:hypothetical protein